MKAIYPIFAALVFFAPAFSADNGRALARASASTSNQRASAAAARAPAATSSRAAAPAVQTRQSQAPGVSARAAATPVISSRATTTTAARAAASVVSRRAANSGAAAVKRPIVSRAATAAVDPAKSTALGDGYSKCRDAYFACMDQFCAMRNEQYRRCVCSSRLTEMRERERNFSAATGMLKDFEDNNLNVIDKTPDEVKAMYKASEGEAAIKKDNSASAKTLSGIGDVLASRGGGDSSEKMRNMAEIWGTTDVIGGADIANLESTALYSAVHAQCAEMVAETCDHLDTFNMVSSAYGMYIEQDCTAYAASLDKQQKQMITTAKQAQGQMAAARLDNYDAHNADAINACLTNVRADMFGAGGCGEDNVKCIDHTGRFIDVTTGEPIYVRDFYLLGEAISLSGDTLKNSRNMPIVNMLNKKKSVAAASLDKCRDIADYVWDEYLRQTLVDLSQRQFAKVRQVQNECVGVVNQCYDDKLENLRNFASDITDGSTDIQQMSLVEEMCHQKLETCALLYDNGRRPPQGLQNLLDYVRGTQIVKVESKCEEYVKSYAEQMCTPVNDVSHGYPYECRFLPPGDLYENQNSINEGTLIGKLMRKAAEVCVYNGENIHETENVKMTVNTVMDDIKFKLDGMLTKECELFEGAMWRSNTLAGFKDGSNILDDFIVKVGSHKDWGSCVYPMCNANEEYVANSNVDMNGVLEGMPRKFCKCQKGNYVYDEVCLSCDGRQGSYDPGAASISKNYESTWDIYKVSDNEKDAYKGENNGVPFPYCRCNKGNLLFANSYTGKCEEKKCPYVSIANSTEPPKRLIFVPNLSGTSANGTRTTATTKEIGIDKAGYLYYRTEGATSTTVAILEPYCACPLKSSDNKDIFIYDGKCQVCADSNGYKTEYADDDYFFYNKSDSSGPASAGRATQGVIGGVIAPFCRCSEKSNEGLEVFTYNDSTGFKCTTCPENSRPTGPDDETTNYGTPSLGAAKGGCSQYCSKVSSFPFGPIYQYYCNICKQDEPPNAKNAIVKPYCYCDIDHISMRLKGKGGAMLNNNEFVCKRCSDFGGAQQVEHSLDTTTTIELVEGEKTPISDLMPSDYCYCSRGITFNNDLGHYVCN